MQSKFQVMNGSQRMCLKLAAWAVGAMCLFPPVMVTDGVRYRSEGFRFIFKLGYLQIHSTQLLTQIFCVLVVTGLLWLSASGARARHD